MTTRSAGAALIAIWALLMVFCFTLRLSSQPALPSEKALSDLDAWIRTFMRQNTVPGALVAVASAGDIVHLQPYGTANIELAVPVRDSTVFEIGSISKQFVAASLLMLEKEGHCDLDDPIHHYLPWLPGEWLGVTIEQLLTHTSGIPDYEEIRSYDVYRFRLTPEAVIRIAQSRPMDFAPGQDRYYSNTGYFLASMILERLDGHPLGAVLEKRIFAPLGMGQSRLADPEAIIPHRAAGYWVNKAGELINRPPTETSSTLGAGGLLSSGHDLIKWDAALYGEELLSAEMKEKMWSPAILPHGENTGYGLGWNVRAYHGLQRQEHSGQVAGFVARFSRFPLKRLSFIVLMNRYQVSSRELSEAVIRTFLPETGKNGDKVTR